MSRKSRGINAERELVHLFNALDEWMCIRTAGSGSQKYPAPDILAGNVLRKIAIECKLTTQKKKILYTRRCQPISQVLKNIWHRGMGCCSLQRTTLVFSHDWGLGGYWQVFWCIHRIGSKKRFVVWGVGWAVKFNKLLLITSFHATINRRYVHFL